MDNVYVVVDNFFFFFKQKTAYEMRISDWSSDVCSSDLPEHHLQCLVGHPPRRGIDDHEARAAIGKGGEETVEQRVADIDAGIGDGGETCLHRRDVAHLNRLPKMPRISWPPSLPATWRPRLEIGRAHV